MLLMSHLVKSTGALIGTAIVLWVLLDFFWGVILLLVSTVLGYGPGSANYAAVTIDSSFFNPAQFYVLVGDYLNGIAINVAGGSTLPISPATYGLTPVTLFATGALWVVIPLLAFIYLATKRD
jgi:hypothetical protein